MMSTQTTGTTLLEQLRDATERSPRNRSDLAKAAGISRKTLFNILEHEQDFKVSSLLALLDVLRLDIALIPREARSLRLSEPVGNSLSPYSRVGHLRAATKKGTEWK